MTVDFNDLNELKRVGFEGFKKMNELLVDYNCIPRVRGVYIVFFPAELPIFIEIGTGGHFKGKNPNIPLSELKQNWVEDAKVIYIGKAGGSEGKATLHSRLKQYFSFGQGKNIGHWGGRLIWQLKESENLVVCWKMLPENDPREIESELLSAFYHQFHQRPFANLRD